MKLPMLAALIAAATVLLPSPIAAGQGATSGTYTGPGGRTVKLEIKARPSMGEYLVRYTDQEGRTTGWHVATPHPSGGVDAAPVLTPRGPDNPDGTPNVGEPTRIHNGRLQVKVDGKWKRMKPQSPKPADAVQGEGVGTSPAEGGEDPPPPPEHRGSRARGVPLRPS